ncbi:response regulator [Cytophagaceae bacterium DM2B3-1]|uniref:Response regulator n=1 Tax=Xanthocytophaga flava TaxID=3048013 RepID=A0ABT7CHF8_9BACT|nr:response regulator [Xanthocytophaga flavus]MDJ1493166.1 response regulator [Xanthocytophaga flavus]
MISIPTQQILLIEDNADYRWELACCLETSLSNCQIVTLSENEEALAWLSYAPVQPDLILWSVDMMLKDNFQQIIAIQNNDVCKYVPIVALADYCNEEWILRCYRMGVKAYVVKPHSKGECLALERIIESFQPITT